MADGDLVTQVQQHRHRVLRGRDGIIDLTALQTEEVVGAAVHDGGADVIHHTGDLGLGPLLLRHDAPLGEQVDIHLLALGHGAGHRHQLILGHIDHGVALHQFGGVLEGDEVGGLSGDVEEEGEGGHVLEVLYLALGRAHSGVLGGAGGLIEPGLLGALIGEEEAQVGLIGIGGGDACVDVHVVVEGDIVVALGGHGDALLTQDGVEKTVDEGSVVVVLLHDEVGGIDVVHPGRDIVNVVILALAGDGVAEHGALNVGAAEQTDGPDNPGGDPVGRTLLIDFELGGVKEVGGVTETQVAHDVAVEGLGEGVLHALLEPHHAGLLGDHVYQHVGGQALAAVGEPLDEVGVVDGGHPDGPALVVDLGGVVGVLELAHHIAEGAHLAVSQVLSGGPVQGGDLVEGDLGDILGEVAILHSKQVPVGGGPEDGHGDQGADDTHGDEEHHEDAHREALGLHKAEVFLHAGAGGHAEAGGEEGGNHKDNAEDKDKGVEVPILEIQGGEGEVEVDEAEHQGDGQADEDAGSFAHGLAGGIPVHKKLLLNDVVGVRPTGPRYRPRWPAWPGGSYPAACPGPNQADRHPSG